MAEEKPKVKSLKPNDSGDTGRSDLLKSALKRPSTEAPDRGDKVLSKCREPLKSGNKDPVRSRIGKNLVKVGKEHAKGNGREQEGKVANKGGSPLVKQETRVSVKDEAKSPVKPSSKEGKVLSKEGKVLTKEGEANGKEQGKRVGKELGKVKGKDSGGVRDLLKVKDEDRNLEREREKGKSPVVKSAVVKTLTKPGSATKIIPKSTNAGASSSLGQSLKKKLMQTKTTIITTTKTVTEQKKEKKVYSLPGQKHDPPEDRDPLRIFYSTLRDQMPESEMAEIWLMEYGLLPQDEAKKALERKQRRGQSLKHGTLSKTSSTPSRLSNGSLGGKKSTPISNGKGKGTGTSSKGKKKREDSESDSDHDFLQKARIKKKLKT